MTLRFEFVPTTLIDFPGKVASIIFIKGCNMRCPYCHNSDMVIPDLSVGYSEDDILRLLADKPDFRKNVSITGGEPLLYRNIIPFLRKIKKLGYNIKIDTNGSKPGVLEEIISEKLVSFIAMDIKTLPRKYNIVGFRNYEPILRSIYAVKNSGIPYEFRTTLVKGIVSPSDIDAIGMMFGMMEKWVLQNFHPTEKCLDTHFSEDSGKSYNISELRLVEDMARRYALKVVIRD